MIKFDNILEEKDYTTKFVFITSSYNQSQFVEKNLESIKNQNYPKNLWRVIYINDASNDSTVDICKKFIKENSDIQFQLISNRNNMGPAYSRHLGYNRCFEDEVCVFLDGDDYLADENVLSIVSWVYKNYQIDATFGSFIQGEEWQYRLWGEYDRKNIRGEDCNFFPHLRTVKAKICKMVPESYLKYNGEWLKFMTDGALFTSVVELAKNYAFIPNLLVDYNLHNSETNSERGYRKGLKNVEQRNQRNIYSKHLKNLSPLKKR